MTCDDIIRMAREAGLTGLREADVLGNFERFAALVAAAEREACARMFDHVVQQGGQTVGDAIRKRGEVKPRRSTSSALRLAEALEGDYSITYQPYAAAELRRLHAENERLREALDNLISACELPGDHCEIEQAFLFAKAALQREDKP